MTKKIFISIAVLLFSWLCVKAVPAKPGNINVEQPDGTVLSVQIHGDEYFSYVTTSDGYLIINIAGQWEYAHWENNQPMSLGIRANDAPMRRAEDIQVLKTVGKFSLSAVETGVMRNAQMQNSGNAPSFSVGKPVEVKRGLVLLVNFSDKAFRTQNTKDKFENMLNLDGYNVNGSIGSANNYFEDMSYGKYSPVFDVYGPVTLDNTMEYYGKQEGGRNDSRPSQMIVDAIAKLMATTEGAAIDLSKYDSDGDKVIDNIFVYYAGNNQAEGGPANSVWPHKSNLVGNPSIVGNLSYRNYTFDNYACSSELKGSNPAGKMCGIGTFCHEFGHVIGLPDIYDTGTPEHGVKLSGGWDIMASGSYAGDGYVPVAYTAYERFFMGWITPKVLDTPEDYILEGLNDSDTAAYIITYDGTHNMDGANPSPNNFYILENRVQDRWDDDAPGYGLIITRVNYSAAAWSSNNVNTNPSNLGVDIIEADGDQANWHMGKQGDAFPAVIKSTNDTIDYYTPLVQYPITKIKLLNDIISFRFMGGLQSYTVTFMIGQYSTSVVNPITESEPKAGIMLPNITPDLTYEFEGWSTFRSAHIVNVGQAGDEYFPKTDIILYAVYSQNGEIVPSNGGCFVESFNGLEGTSIVTNNIDALADNEGWTGTALYSDGGALKVGSTSVKGSLTTPELNLAGNAKISIKAKGSGIVKLNITVNGSGVLDKNEVRLSSYYQDVEFSVTGIDYTTKLVLSASANEFYIDSLEVCLSTETSTDIVSDNKIVVINNEYISGLEKNSIVKCIDMNGKLLWTKMAEDNILYFTAPKGVYMIYVIKDGESIGVKNLN